MKQPSFRFVFIRVYSWPKTFFGSGMPLWAKAMMPSGPMR